MPELTTSTLTRRETAHQTVSVASKGALAATVIAAVGWVAISFISAPVFLISLVATALVGVVAVMRTGPLPLQVWAGVGILWTALALQNWVLHDNGGLLLAGCGWLGMLYALTKKNTSKWILALLAYPLIGASVLLLIGQSVQQPFGFTWLWVPFVLGPVIALQVILAPKKEKAQPADTLTV